MASLAVKVLGDAASLKAALANADAIVTQTTDKMVKLSKSFDGSKLLSNADAMTRAVNDLGGAAILTEKEAGKVNAQLQAAIDKAAKLGQESPSHILALRDATAQVEKPMSAVDSLMGMIGPKIIATFSIGAIVGFVSSLVESASHVQDLSNKMGVSTDAAQKWEYAVKLSGGTIDDVSRAMIAMQKNLDGGGASVVAALKTAGIAFADIKDLNPEQSFNAITEAIKGIEDPMTQARIATELFDKAGATMLPAIRDGFKEIGDQAPIMSKDTIEAFDMIGDAWTTTTAWIKSQTAEFITKPFRDWKNLITDIKQDLSDLGTVPVPALFKIEMPKFGATGKELDALAEASEKLREETEKDVSKWEAYNAELQKHVDILTGKALASKVKELTTEVIAAGKQGGITAFEMKELGKQTSKLFDEGAKLTPELHKIWVEHISLQLQTRTTTTLTSGLVTQIKNLGTSAKLEAVPSLAAMTTEINKHLILGPQAITMLGELGTKIETLPLPPPLPTTMWTGFGEEASRVLGEVERGVAGHVVSLIGHASHWKSASAEIWGEIKDGIFSVLTEILVRFEKAFIGGLINLITGAKGGFSGAFAGLFGGLFGGGAAAGSIGTTIGITAPGAAAGGTAGGSVGGSVLPYLAPIAAVVGAGWIVSEMIRGERSSEWDTGISQEEYDRRYPMGPTPDQLNSDEWRAANGYAGGTRNLDYQNFGTASPTWLHRDEAVIPRGGGHRLAGEIAASMGSGGGRQIIQLVVGARVLAEVVYPELDGAGRRLGYT